MKLIVGLGNPGINYEKTRHNVGFLSIDNYTGNVKWQKKFSGLFYENIINKEKICFLKPQTFMNESGISVKEIMDYYNILAENILIIHDDLDIEIGDYKLKRNSSSGGHNGLKSIIDHIGTDSFLRLKVGISNDKTINTKDYVTGKISKDEMKILNPVILKSKEVIDSFIINGIEKTMNIYNTK